MTNSGALVETVSLTKLFRFKTKFNGQTSFSITKSGAGAIWYMGDGTVYTNTNFVTHTYIDGSEKTVTVESTDSETTLTALGAFNNREITHVDLSTLSNVSGTLNFSSNPELTTWIQPSNVGGFCSLRISSCDLTGNLDISNVLIGGAFYLYINPNLTSVTFRNNNTQYSTDFRIQSCNITGSFDLSNIKIQGGICALNSNPLMTSITFSSDNTQVCTSFSITNCDINGVLDVSMIDMSGIIYMYNNPNLIDILHKPTNGSFSIYFAFNTKVTTLDLSMLKYISGDIRVYSCPSMKSIKFPSNNPSVPTVIDLSNNLILASIDLSGFININGSINLHTNPECESITFNSVQGSGSCSIVAYNCNKLKSLDLSKIDLVSVLDVFNCLLLNPLVLNTTSNSSLINRIRTYGLPQITNLDMSRLKIGSNNPYIQAHTNPKLETYEPPKTNEALITFDLYNLNTPQGVVGVFELPLMSNYLNIDNHYTRFHNNTWTVAEVNEMLFRADSIAVGGFVNRNFLFLSGNASPDSTSGGFNGIAARNSLIAKGFTIV